jgi:hypothetical protein
MARAHGTRPQATPSASRAAELPPAEGAGHDSRPWWPPLAVIAAGIAVFFGALQYFFAQDDFAGLARASGVLPRLSGVWRYLSGQLYFDLMWRTAGLDPRPYHLASLLAHLGCALLLYHLMARRLTRPAALVGAVYFAVHPALFTALYSISGIGEILALLFALVALRVAPGSGRGLWAVVIAFALSLLAKESTLLLPVAMALGVAILPRDRGRARRAALAIAVIAALYAVEYLRSDVFRVREGLSQAAAYALADPGEIGRNLLTYLGWTLNLFLPTVREIGDAVDPAAFPWGIALAVIWLAGLLSPTLRSRGWGTAGITYLLFLAPVLPLRNHTYHYYLYAPLAGAAWGLAALFDGWVVTRLGWRTSMNAATAVAVLLALNGALLVHKIERAPYVVADLRSAPVVDRARIARNVYDALRTAALPDGARLEFWSPSLAAAENDRARLASERYWSTNLRAALFDSVGVRVMFPRLAAVRFVEQPPIQPTSDRVALYGRDGRLRVITAAVLDSLLRVHPLE